MQRAECRGSDCLSVWMEIDKQRSYQHVKKVFSTRWDGQLHDFHGLQERLPANRTEVFQHVQPRSKELGICKSLRLSVYCNSGPTRGYQLFRWNDLSVKSICINQRRWRAAANHQITIFKQFSLNLLWVSGHTYLGRLYGMWVRETNWSWYTYLNS